MEENLEYEEIICQEYEGNKAILSAGFVHGHPIDTMYLRLHRENEDATIIILRLDEMAAIAWLASGVLFSHEVKNV